jgi:hypothetical protein
MASAALLTSDGWDARWICVVLSCGRCGHAVEVHVQRAAARGRRADPVVLRGVRVALHRCRPCPAAPS